jgi:hypothetical protein
VTIHLTPGSIPSYDSHEEAAANWRRRHKAVKKGKVHIFPVRTPKGTGYLVGGRLKATSESQLAAEYWCQERTPVRLSWCSRPYGTGRRPDGS